MAKKNRTYTKGNREYERRRQKVGKVLIGVKGDYKLDNIKSYVNSRTELGDASQYLEVNENGLLVVDPSAPRKYSKKLDHIVGEINSWKRDIALTTHLDGRKNQLRERSLDSHLLEMETREQANRMKMFFNAGYDNMSEVAEALGVSELDVADESRWDYDEVTREYRFYVTNKSGNIIGYKEFVFGYGGQSWFKHDLVTDVNGVQRFQLDESQREDYEAAKSIYRTKDQHRNRVWFKSRK